MKLIDAIKRLLRHRFRDAVTGRFTTKKEAKENPSTTVRELVQ